MSVLHFPRTIAIALLFVLAGYSQGSIAAGEDKVAESDVVGKWQVVKIETSDGKPLPDGLQKDVLSEYREIRADHTYGFFSSMAGRQHGTWTLSGDTVTFKSESGGTLTPLKFQPPHLISSDEGLSLIYEKQGSAAVEKAIVISAADLSKAFLADKAAASAKYKGKSLQVAGIVFDPAGGSSRAEGLTLEGTPDPKNQAGDPMFMGGQCPVKCYLDPGQIKAGTQLTKGQEVTVQGTCDEVDFLGALWLTGGSVIKTGTDPAMVISAADLAKAYGDDDDAAGKKYEGKQVKVEGKVQSLDEKNYNITLEGTGSGDNAVSVLVRVGYEGWKIAKDLKVGQVVKVKGAVQSYNKPDKAVHLADTTRFVD